MRCNRKNSKTEKDDCSPKKRKRLPSINPFFHFLKCVWKKFKGCKRSVAVRYAVKKWRRMSKIEKKPFFEAACRAQALHCAGRSKANPCLEGRGYKLVKIRIPKKKNLTKSKTVWPRFMS